VHEELELRRNELLTMSRQATTLYMQAMQPGGVFTPKPQMEDAEPAGEEQPREQLAVKKELSGMKKGDVPAEEGKPSRLTPRDCAELDRMTDKRQKIRYLSAKGLNISEMARELNIGKGEIHLILDLDKG
jgi:hypothetical protein